MILYNEGELIVFKDLAGDVYLGRISIRWTDSEGKIRYCVRDVHNDPRYQNKRVHNVTPDRIIETGAEQSTEEA